MGSCIGKGQPPSPRTSRVERRQRNADQAQQSSEPPSPPAVAPPPAAAGLQGLVDLGPCTAVTTDPGTAAPRGLLQLPPELIANIGRRLSPSDRINLSESSRLLYAMRPLYFPDVVDAAVTAGVHDLPQLLAIVHRLEPYERAVPLAALTQRFIEGLVPQATAVGTARRLLDAAIAFPPAQRSPLLRALAAHIVHEACLHGDAVRHGGAARLVDDFADAAAAIRTHDGGAALAQMPILNAWGNGIRAARSAPSLMWLSLGVGARHH